MALKEIFKPRLHLDQRTWTVGRELDGRIYLEMDGIGRARMTNEQAMQMASAIFEMAGYKLEKLPKVILNA